MPLVVPLLWTCGLEWTLEDAWNRALVKALVPVKLTVNGLSAVMASIAKELVRRAR